MYIGAVGYDHDGKFLVRPVTKEYEKLIHTCIKNFPQNILAYTTSYSAGCFCNIDAQENKFILQFNLAVGMTEGEFIERVIESFNKFSY